MDEREKSGQKLTQLIFLHFCFSIVIKVKMDDDVAKSRTTNLSLSGCLKSLTQPTPNCSNITDAMTIEKP